jgi:putative transposase
LRGPRRQPSDAVSLAEAISRLWREIGADCRGAGLKPPSIRRLGRWLALQDQAELLRRREGKGKSELIFLATPGTLRAEAPLDIVEIDHTKVDVTVVDPASRKPIGRPTLTLAIDVATRMATGFHLSLSSWPSGFADPRE